MKLHYAVLPIAGLLGGVASQGLEGLPDCAKSCASDSIPKHCELIDVGCICSDKSFITNISCCVAKACASDKQQAVINFANQLCKGAGVTDLPQSASCANGGATATETKSSASNATKSSKTAASASTTESAESTTSATSSETGENTASSTSPTNSAAATTGGAVLLQGSDIGIVAAAGAALFAFLA